MGKPPADSDNNFNPSEDFAESVTAYVYPVTAQEKAAYIAMLNPNLYNQFLFYSDYTKTTR